MRREGHLRHAGYLWLVPGWRTSACFTHSRQGGRQVRPQSLTLVGRGGVAVGVHWAGPLLRDEQGVLGQRRGRLVVTRHGTERGTGRDGTGSRGKLSPGAEPFTAGRYEVLKHRLQLKSLTGLPVHHRLGTLLRVVRIGSGHVWSPFTVRNFY